MYFIHGTDEPGGHIHVVYESLQNNSTRTRKRVVEDLPPYSQKFEQANATATSINNRRGYLLYLCRRGLKSGYQVGAGVSGLVRQLEALKDVPEEAMDRCLQWINEKRKERKRAKGQDPEDEDSATTSYMKMWRTLEPEIERIEPETFNDLQMNMDMAKQVFCMQTFGPKYIQYATAMVSMHKKLEYQRIRNTKYWILQQQYLDKHPKDTPHSVYEWFDKVFKANMIKPVEFFAKFICIMDKLLDKINTFTIRGFINTGKSLFTFLLTACMKPVTVMRQGEASSFHFANLIDPGCCKFEEPNINPHNVNTMKLLFGGEECSTDVKNQSAHKISRVPICCTTNYKLGAP